jgi:hypothetical protein
VAAVKTGKLVAGGVFVLVVLFALYIQPIPAAASASGNFSNISFPGCDIVLSGGTVNIVTGNVHVVVKQGATVLKDDTRPILGGQIQQFTIYFVDFAKPTGTSLSVKVDVDGDVIADLAGEYPSACLTADLSKIPSYLRDGRVDPAPGDRLAIWCNKDQQIMDVWGVDNESRGYRLARFTASELAAAGPGGVTKSTKGLGVVSASMDRQGNIWVAWNGGAFGANGRDSFAKGLNCHFAVGS